MKAHNRKRYEENGKDISDIFDNIAAIKGQRIAEFGEFLVLMKQMQFAYRSFSAYLASPKSDQRTAQRFFDRVCFAADDLAQQATFAALQASGIDEKDLEDVIPQLDTVMVRLVRMSKAVLDDAK